MGYLVLSLFAMFCLLVYMLVWVYKDAKANAKMPAILCVILILIFLPYSFAIYMALRKRNIPQVAATVVYKENTVADMMPQKASFVKRLEAIAIDLVSLLILFGGYIFITDLLGRAVNFPAFLMVSLAYMSLKDMIGAASVGKRIYKLRVRCANNPELTPSWYMLFLRNILAFLWPIELIVLMLTKRKIGDYITKSDVYALPKKNEFYRFNDNEKINKQEEDCDEQQA